MGATWLLRGGGRRGFTISRLDSGSAYDRMPPPPGSSGEYSGHCLAEHVVAIPISSPSPAHSCLGAPSSHSNTGTPAPQAHVFH